MTIAVNSPFNPAAAAQRLADAWRRDELLQDLPPQERPASLEDGYAVQDCLAKELREPIAGYKLGLSSPNAMQRSGLGKPITGFMPVSRVFRPGASLPLTAKDKFLIEVEIAFELAHEIRGEEPAPDFASSIRSAYLSIEVVRSHFADRSKVSLPCFVADGSGFHAFICGPSLTLEQVLRVSDSDIRLFRDGTEVTRKASAHDRPDPLHSLRTFMAMTSDRGRVLPEGLLVSTGNLVMPYETDIPGNYRASFDGLAVDFSLQPVSEL